MGPLETKHSIMILQRKPRRNESVHRMARLAAANRNTLRQLTGVLVAVAIGTARELDAPPRRAPPVAACTCQLAVPTAQGIASAVVIEGRLVDPLPTSRRVAALAGLAELAGVRILVTIGTPPEIESRETSELRIVTERLRDARMATLTSDVAMQAGQREPRFLVPEAGRREPLCLGMAARAAIGLELSSMLVAVTRQAFCPQTQKCPPQTLALPAQALRISIELGPMAFPAAEIGVTTSK